MLIPDVFFSKRTTWDFISQSWYMYQDDDGPNKCVLAKDSQSGDNRSRVRSLLEVRSSKSMLLQTLFQYMYVFLLFGVSRWACFFNIAENVNAHLFIVGFQIYLMWGFVEKMSKNSDWNGVGMQKNNTKIYRTCAQIFPKSSKNDPIAMKIHLWSVCRTKSRTGRLQDGLWSIFLEHLLIKIEPKGAFRGHIGSQNTSHLWA